MNKIQQQIKKLSGKRVIVHTGFILSGALILLLLLKYYFNNGIERQGYISVLYFFVCVYTGRWICKTWFLKNKLILFSAFTILGFFVLLYGGKLILNGLLPLNQKNMDEFFFAITPLFILGMLTGIFVPMISGLLQKQAIEAKQMAAQKQDELNLLQSQLSPHFLFNTLNNLYAISITQQEKIPGLLLKLSDLLRYSVYETRHVFIPLREEVQYINNYISFEKIRIGERLNLKTDIEAMDGDGTKIAPMLLIVYIENAFKHAKDTLDKKIFIDINLKVVNGNIIFFSKNSCKELNETKITGKAGGLGLDNVKKRLELLYANEYKLQEEKLENFYTVTLQLKVK
jgi:sensor histidine kinase YesM